MVLLDEVEMVWRNRLFQKVPCVYNINVDKENPKKKLDAFCGQTVVKFISMINQQLKLILVLS